MLRRRSDPLVGLSARRPRRRALASLASLVLAALPPLLASVASAAPPAGPAPGGSEEAAPWRWRFARSFGAPRGARAVAFDPRARRLAVGGEEGVRAGPVGGRGRTVLRRGPVQDLAFDAAGGLLAATPEGLYRVGREGRSAERSPGPGSAARRVRRVAAAGPLLLAATADGLYLAAAPAEGGSIRWRHADAGVPAGPARAAIVRGPEGERELFVLLERGLYRARLAAAAREPRLRDARRVPLPGSGRPEALRDLALAPRGRVLVLAGASLTVLPAGGGGAGGAGEGEGDRGAGKPAVHRPALPPGVRPRRVLAAAGAVWLATDRGLLRAPRAAGPYRRVPPPAGRADVRALASGAGRLFAAAGRGVLVGAPREREAAGGAAGEGAPGVPWAGEPDVAAVQRVALRHQGLGPAAMRALRRGARRRGWLPEVELEAGYDRARERDLEIDDAYTASRSFERDRSRDREVDLSLELRWDLRALVFDPAALDVSDEAREVIELRDDLLDEITQLYFERRRVLRELERVAREAGPEARARAGELRLRADELAAGLDAWTGGWWSRRVAPRSTRGVPLSPPPEGPEEEAP